MRVDRIEIAFQGRLIQPAQLDRDIVKSSGREPAVEVPQPRNSHANDRNVDVGAGVIENEESSIRPSARTRSVGQGFSRSLRFAN